MTRVKILKKKGILIQCQRNFVFRAREKGGSIFLSWPPGPYSTFLFLDFPFTLPLFIASLKMCQLADFPIDVFRLSIFFCVDFLKSSYLYRIKKCTTSTVQQVHFSTPYNFSWTWNFDFEYGCEFCLKSYAGDDWWTTCVMDGVFTWKKSAFRMWDVVAFRVYPRSCIDPVKHGTPHIWVNSPRIPDLKKKKKKKIPPSHSSFFFFR